jgi:hypothetical protein
MSCRRFCNYPATVICYIYQYDRYNKPVEVYTVLYNYVCILQNCIEVEKDNNEVEKRCGVAGLTGRDGSSFDRLTMTAHHGDGNVILSLSKGPLTPTPFDRLTTPLSLGGEREIRVVIFPRRPRSSVPII